MLGFILAPLLLAAGPAPGAPAALPVRTIIMADSRLADVRAGLLRRVARGELVSIAVTVTEQGRTVWEEAFGWADREAGIPAEATRPYAVGSLSKSLAATTILTLAGRGEVDMDTPVDRWIPLAAPADIAARPTLRQLLDASGGIPHGWESRAPTAMPRRDAEWDVWLARDAFVAFPPGTVFEYSNNSFGVAAPAVERATGTPFATLARTRLFLPMGMTNTLAVPGATDPDRAAAPYSSRGERIERAAGIPEAGLGMLASAEDLARFGNFVRNGAVSGTPPLSPSRRAELWRPATGPSGGFFHYGFWNGGRALVTNGSIAGANAYLGIGRDEDLVVAVTVNQAGNDADDAAKRIMDVLLPTDPNAPDLHAAYVTRFRSPYTPGALAGEWAGALHGGATRILVALSAGRESVRVRLGDAGQQPLRSASLSAFGTLRGYVEAAIPGLTDPAPEPGRINLVLSWSGDTMRGYALPWGRDAIPVRLELERVAAAPTYPGRDPVERPPSRGGARPGRTGRSEIGGLPRADPR